jgi:hypothetical protein
MIFCEFVMWGMNIIDDFLMVIFITFVGKY